MYKVNNLKLYKIILQNIELTLNFYWIKKCKFKKKNWQINRSNEFNLLFYYNILYIYSLNYLWYYNLIFQYYFNINYY